MSSYQIHERGSAGRAVPFRLCAGLMLSLALLLSGCAGVPQADDPETLVKQRAQQRLDLLMAGRVEESFRYTTPAYQQGRGLAFYTRAYAGVSSWNKAEVTGVNCTGARCEVSLRVRYPAIRGGFENERSLDERWIEVDGNWYLYLR